MSRSRPRSRGRRARVPPDPRPLVLAPRRGLRPRDRGRDEPRTCLYRDIWIDNPFPGAFALLALWFHVAGTSIASARVLTLAGFAVYATALFWTARLLLPRGAALGFAAFVIAWRVWAFPRATGGAGREAPAR